MHFLKTFSPNLHLDVCVSTPFVPELTLFLDNVGKPNEVRLRNGSTVMWHRSTPYPGLKGDLFFGIQLYDGLPYVSGNTFADFYDDDFKIAGAISFRKPHGGDPPTIFKNNHFDYEDGIEGNYIRGSERFTFGGLG